MQILDTHLKRRYPFHKSICNDQSLGILVDDDDHDDDDDDDDGDDAGDDDDDDGGDDDDDDENNLVTWDHHPRVKSNNI